MKKRPVSLLWRVMLSTSIAITVLFGSLGWVIQEQFGRIATETIEGEVRSSFQAYESLWRARVEELASVSLVISRLPDIRAAFGTRDAATIQDTAGEVWGRLSQGGTLFLVAEPDGSVIAQVGTGGKLVRLDFMEPATRKFPDQVRGFVILNGGLYQVVLTPVYVASGAGSGLLNVLVMGIQMDAEHVAELKAVTGGSDFRFEAGGHEFASTVTTAPGEDSFRSTFPLKDIEGRTIGELSILRSFEEARQRIDAMRVRLIALWIGAVAIGLGMTFWLTKRLLRPLGALSGAAAEIGRGNYRVHVPVDGAGEIATLAESFNTMTENVSKAREELIRQERISTIGRLSASIVHDLRNPLAAIYGGAEMLVDQQLSEAQTRRLAANIYSASRKVQDMLQELADVTHGRGHVREVCRLRDVVQAAYEPLAANAEASRVQVTIDVGEVELPLDRSPMERVFQNLIGNAIEAMPQGGRVEVRAEAHENGVNVCVEDSGPGIPKAIVSDLFQPFVTAGKKNGVGLGLALSRKTVLAHGGDLWAEEGAPGARFWIRLPV